MEKSDYKPSPCLTLQMSGTQTLAAYRLDLPLQTLRCESDDQSDNPGAESHRSITVFHSHEDIQQQSPAMIINIINSQ